MSTESGISVRDSYKLNSSREDPEDEVAGAHHSYIFEPEDTSSDCSESSNTSHLLSCIAP